MSQHLGRYRLEEAIGVGSFATVHRAVDEHLDDVVAVKVLAENHSMSPEIRERFIAEGRALRRVGGEHCAEVHDIGESERLQPYLVMELADRGSLGARVAALRQQGWRATADDLLVFARELAAGVDDVHRARLVHRDLSPGNLLLASRGSGGLDAEDRPPSCLVAPDERLLLADLGMCKDLALNSGLTVAGGTSGFRPPEQDAPGVVDIRADIWAMSALLQWLADDADLPRPAARALAGVLRRGMARRPKDRPADANRWLHEVEGALAPADEAAPSPDPAASHSVSTSPPRARVGRWLAVVTAVVALACGLWAGWQLGDSTPPASVGGASIAIIGPDEVVVGESAVFTVDLDGVDTWVWTLPTGRYVVDEQEVAVRATSAGSGRVVLAARSPEGADLLVTHTFRVVEK
ncbi:serine/threonine-protein kinase [Tessaracoccus terricola]